MNMLNTEMRALASFSKEEQESFQAEASKGSCLEFLDAVGVWHERESDTLLSIGGAYRLKLVEGAWYANEFGLIKVEMVKNSGFSFTHYYGESEEDKKNGVNGNWMGSQVNSNWDNFQPATQAEIEAVKPQETFIDVEIDYKGTYPKCKCPDGFGTFDITNIPIGRLLNNWSLRGYKFESSDCICSYPVKSTVTEFQAKATHVRFINVSQ